ncbi:MAG: Asp-tRNA(Asn)/Glu-tRNA(Gln) amidotransferase subunit GatA [Verrucomicrobiae bacterium]|nr:Asp-tRNA(Asn)/Glu-tRNA(Gln) amidotransferase subunit GatA [Verrucomicrobiae bacterium]
MPLTDRPIHELLPRLAKKEIAAADLAHDVAARIEAVDGRIHAFLEWDRDELLAAARDVDERRARGEALGPLAGVPVGIKDVINVKGHTCRCGSKILQGYVAPYDATVIAKLRAAGAIPVGRLNMDEFAMGSSQENSAFGVTRNPWDLDRIPGGSSGGSAAAVAAGEVQLTLGSDTGGSIRQPAAVCGVVGLKPTYGRVSRYGLVAFASSLDQIGPFARDVTDAALLFAVIAGHDPNDSTSLPEPVPDYTRALTGDVRGLRLGLPKEYFTEGMDREVETAVRAAVKTLASLGAEIVEISLPHTAYALAVYYIIATAEASANLARFDGVRYGFRAKDAKDPMDMYGRTRGAGFGPEVTRRIILGTYVLSSGYYDAYYLRAQKVRTLIRRDFTEAFQRCDAILTPTSPVPAFRIGERADDPLTMYLSDIFTVSANIAGICGVSVPCGFTAQPKLPIGLQVLGKPFGEETILRVAHAYEQATAWHRERPVIGDS